MAVRFEPRDPIRALVQVPSPSASTDLGGRLLAPAEAPLG